MMKKLIFSGRTAPPVINKDGSRNMALWARVWDDASVTVSMASYAQPCAPTPQERIEALEAAVRAVAGQVPHPDLKAMSLADLDAAIAEQHVLRNAARDTKCFNHALLDELQQEAADRIPE
jgi:hypothetical protein